MQIMKKVLYILNDCMRKFTYERTAGFWRALKRLDEPVDLHIVRSDGYSEYAPEHNYGEYNIFRLPFYDSFDGIILDINSVFTRDSDEYASESIRYAIETAVHSGKPVLSLANELKGCVYVGIDNYSAMQSVIRHLHKVQGLHDFWFAMGPPDNFENLERTKGLLDYCKENSLPCSEDRFYAESFITECGIHAFETLLARHRGVLPQVVICATDYIALGICHAAEEAGFSIPHDLMVTGFDNDDVSSLSPSITTVDQSSWSMGDYCADALQRIWRGEALPSKIYTPTELVLRESTGQVSSHSDARKKIREYIDHSSRAMNYSYCLSMLQYQLPGCKSIEEMGGALVQCLSRLKCKGVSLILDSALFDNSVIRQPGQSYITADSLPVEGYSDRMELAFSWDEITGNQNNAARSFSGTMDVPDNYLFSPIHFMEHAVGYLVIKDCVNLIRIKGVSYIVNTLTMALRSHFYEKNLAYMNQLLSGISRKDELTSLYNRLGYHDLAYPLFRSQCEEGCSLGILFLDLDCLKAINDTYGHAMGDLAIRSVSNAIRSSIPENALALRYGGDEFLILFPNATETIVRNCIQEVRSSLSREADRLGAPGSLDVSAGFIISDPGAQKTLDQYVQEADEKMYSEKKAKKKNRLTTI